MLHTGYRYCTSPSNEKKASIIKWFINLESTNRIYALNLYFQPKKEIDGFKADTEQQGGVATKHKLFINPPGNSINPSVYFTTTQYSTTTQKGSSQDYRIQGTNPVRDGDSGVARNCKRGGHDFYMFFKRIIFRPNKIQAD